MSVNFFCVGDGLLSGRVGDGGRSASLAVPDVSEDISQPSLATRVDEALNLFVFGFPSLPVRLFGTFQQLVDDCV